MNSASINLDSLLMCRVHIGWRRHQDKQMQDLRGWLILKLDHSYKTLKRENEKAEYKKTKVASKHNKINDKLKKNKGSQPPPSTGTAS